MVKKSNTGILIVVIIIFIILFGKSLGLFALFVEGDKVAVTTQGSDLICGTQDDNEIFIEENRLCSVIELANKKQQIGKEVLTQINYVQGFGLSSLGIGKNCEYYPQIGSPYSHKPLCNTPKEILQMKGISTDILTCEDMPSESYNCKQSTCTAPGGIKYSCPACDSRRVVSELFVEQHQCGPFFIVNGKMYKDEPITVIDNKITQTRSKTIYTGCALGNNWECEVFKEKAIDFLVLPKISNARCDKTSNCIQIACGQLPAEECIKYQCVDNQCTLEIPTTTTTTTISPTTTTSLTTTTTTIPSVTTTTIPEDDFEITEEETFWERLVTWFKELFEALGF